MGKYRIRHLGTGGLYEDGGGVRYHDDALHRTEYSEGMTARDLPGLWRWVDWLPVSRAGPFNAGSVCYKSHALASALGLSDLWISFHGYWPERGGACPTTTFKDLEAVTTLQWLKDHGVPGLLCSSAGNTARAFAYFGGLAAYPVLLILAEKHLRRLWVPEDHRTDSIRVLGIKGGDYGDASEVTSKILESGGWIREGGAHNVARRDGIGTLLLTAVESIGRMPEHYFQGVGGGPGPIGVHEMAKRVISAGLADGPEPRQHLSQNAEFCPIHQAWQRRSRQLRPMTTAVHHEVYSDLLINRSPAYTLRGGLFDTLTESEGATYAVAYGEAAQAERLFRETEGIDSLAPGSVALAALLQAISMGEVGRRDTILLNISGGGQERYLSEHKTRLLIPAALVTKQEAVELGRRMVG